MVCGDPESGTDHSIKEVSAYIIRYRVHIWSLGGKCHKLFFYALLFISTNNIQVIVNYSSEKGT